MDGYLIKCAECGRVYYSDDGCSCVCKKCRELLRYREELEQVIEDIEFNKKSV